MLFGFENGVQVCILCTIVTHHVIEIIFHRGSKNSRNAASDGFVCIKSTAVSKASSNFSREEYRQRFRIKGRDVSPSPILWWAYCWYIWLNELTSGHKLERYMRQKMRRPVNANSRPRPNLSVLWHSLSRKSSKMLQKNGHKVWE